MSNIPPVGSTYIIVELDAENPYQDGEKDCKNIIGVVCAFEEESIARQYVIRHNISHEGKRIFDVAGAILFLKGTTIQPLKAA